MDTKHTPTPWIAEGQQIVAEENGYRVAIVSSPHPRARGKERMEDLEYCRGNTAFIVRAANSHEQLVAALRDAIEIIQSIDQTDNTCDARVDVSYFRAVLDAAGVA